jgi:hypothetical protein
MITYTEIPNPNATVWSDFLNLSYYANTPANALIRPQYTIDKLKITYRGYLYVPLDNGSGGTVIIYNGDTYRDTTGCDISELPLSVIQNANSYPASAYPSDPRHQARFFSNDVVNLKNFPSEAIPQQRNIVFREVPTIRRYLGSTLALYRSSCIVMIHGVNTLYKDPVGNFGIGCISIFSPYAEEWSGNASIPPLGNDPTALLISKATSGILVNDYIKANDDTPFNIPAESNGYTNPFTVNAHDINTLGGFFVNLEGLTGYLN